MTAVGGNSASSRLGTLIRRPPCSARRRPLRNWCPTWPPFATARIGGFRRCGGGCGDRPAAAGFARDSGYRYRYDPQGRLIVAESIVVERPIQYDDKGNRRAIELGGKATSYSYAAGTNRLLAARGSPAEPDFAYDANGDVIRATPRGIANIDYDPVSKLALTIAMQSGDPLRLQYDGSDLRVLTAAPARRECSISGIRVSRCWRR
jgi:hypothetical protein